MPGDDAERQMRNVYQTQIDACQGDKRRLTALHIAVAEFLRSLDDAILDAPAGGERQVALDALKREVNEALLQIDKLCGW